MLQDFRIAFRTLRKSPGFTAATVLTLALGIGANSAMFSVVDALLIRPLPYQDPQQLTLIYSTAPGSPRNFVAQRDLDDWRAAAKSFSGFASLVPQSVNLTGGGEEPDRVVGSFVSANYFSLLKVLPAMGRTFVDGEDRAGAEKVAVLTDRLWHQKFGADSGVVGRKAFFNGEPYRIAGVLPASFIDQPWDVDVFLPAYAYPNYSLDRASPIGGVIGRMKPGVTLQQAQAEMSTIAAGLAKSYPDSNRDRGAAVVALKDVVVQNLRPTVQALAGAVGFVLLIACANVAGLFASRIVAREKERSVRLALGASAAQLIAHVMAEALLLAAAGGAAGVLIAMWSIAALGASVVQYLPTGTQLTLNGTVIWFTAGMALLSSLLISGIPAWRSARAPSLQLRGAGSSALRNRTRSFIAAVEVALAMVLLVGAGLTIKSLRELGRAQPGFDTTNLLTFEYRLPRAKYSQAAAQTEFHKRVIEEIQAVPGVIVASSVRAAPLGGNGEIDDFWATDRPEPAANDRPRGLFNAADPYFFASLRIPLLRGRVFNERDIAGGAPVIVINQTLAQRYFADRDPIGRSLRIPQQNMTGEIIGVVGDVKQYGLDDIAAPQMYGALAQNPFLFTSVAVRTSSDPGRLMNEIRKAVWRVDRDQPMWKMRTSESRIATLAQPHEFVTSLLGGYATLALILAAIGIFGVVAYSVSQRTAEIGIRMALGARRKDVGRMILTQGLWMAVIGVTAGAGAAMWLTRYLQSELYQVSTLDPGVYIAVALVLGMVTVAACLIPARRAMRVDPLEALRHE